MRYALAAILVLCGGCLTADYFGRVDGRPGSGEWAPGEARSVGEDVGQGVDRSIETGSPMPLILKAGTILTTLLAGGYGVRQHRRARRVEEEKYALSVDISAAEEQLMAAVSGIWGAEVPPDAKKAVAAAVKSRAEEAGVGDLLKELVNDLGMNVMKPAEPKATKG